MNERDKNNPESEEGFVKNNMPQYYKIKMPDYYIAKYSYEDLRSAVLAEREACARIIEDMVEQGIMDGHAFKAVKAIRARGEK